MPMSRCANKEAPAILSRAFPPLARFSPGLFALLQEIPYQSFLALI